VSEYRYGGPAALAHALSFTAQDLEANRQGALSERQVRRVQRRTAVSVVRAAAICLPAFIALALLFNAATIDGVLWALMLAGAPFVFTALRLWPGIEDVNALLVGSVKGQATAQRWQPIFWQRGGWLFRMRPGYYFYVEGVRFRVSRQAFLALQEGCYTLYFMPSTRQVVSAEAA
jgi:hypothetical protein